MPNGDGEDIDTGLFKTVVAIKEYFEDVLIAVEKQHIFYNGVELDDDTRPWQYWSDVLDIRPHFVLDMVIDVVDDVVGDGNGGILLPEWAAVVVAEHVVDDVGGILLPEWAAVAVDEQSEYILLNRVHGDKAPVKVPVAIHTDCPMSLKRIIMQMSGDTLNYDDFEITKDGTHVIGDEMVSLETLGVTSGDKLTLKVNVLAGGKRGRADKSKASRLSELREEAGNTQLRINAHPNMAPTITGILHICLQLTGEMQNAPNDIVSWMFARTPGDKLREMLTVCSGPFDVCLSSGTSQFDKDLSAQIFTCPK